MATVAGIDEAGFGPVLGPMVVCATAFSVPNELVDVSLWRLLAGAVCRRPSKRRLVAIDDSKKLYGGLRGPEGLERLERGVLAMLATQPCRPRSLRELLGALCPQATDRLADYPWYAGVDLALPRTLSATDVALSANALSLHMEAAPVKLLLARAEPVLPLEYNRLVEATRNKSVVLLDLTCRLLALLWRKAPQGLLRVHVDRQGGRARYLPALQRAFPGCQFKVLEECQTLSAYRLVRGERVAEIDFRVQAESHHLPTALASMLAKYLRELLMLPFNGYWAEKVVGLAPTAGYYSDGNRFYREILPHMRKLGIDERLVYRSR